MKVLLLDAAFSAVPIHQFLMERGYDVWTMGYRPEDPLALAYTDKWICGNYGNSMLVRQLIRDQNFDAVIPGCTDVSMSTFVELGLKKNYHLSPEINTILNNKVSFRRLCLGLRIPAPRCVDINELPPFGKFICKPADSFSGRGVTVFDAADRDAVAAAARKALLHSPRNELICEDFIDGELHSYSVFLRNGTVETSFIVREGSRHDPFAVDTSYVCQEFDGHKLQHLRTLIETIARDLRLCDGLLHTQFIDAGSEISIIEMTRRCPGDLYARLIEFSTGYRYAEHYAASFLGVHVRPSLSNRRHVMRHTVKQDGQSKFFGLDIPIPGVFQVTPVTCCGGTLDPEQNSRVAVVFAEAGSYEDLHSLFSRTTK